MVIQGIPEKWTGVVENVSLDLVSGVFKKHPVYTIRANSIKKTVARMVLKNVEVANGELTITLGI